MMKKWFLLLIGCLFIFTGCVEEKKFEVPKLTGRVVDTTNTLSEQEKKDIENAILNFEKNTGGQFAVCIVPEMYGETVESASMKVAEAWKIGKEGEDNGIIFFMSMKEREFRIEVGYGYEGKINDAKAGDLGRAAIPFFKEKKWTHGIISIINGSSDIISGKKSANIANEKEQELPIWVVVLIIAVIVFFVIVCKDDITCVSISSGGPRGGSSGGGFSGGGGSFGGGGFSGKF
jgi:uncharacterized protein